jgi:hypothetical protein
LDYSGLDPMKALLIVEFVAAPLMIGLILVAIQGRS